MKRSRKVSEDVLNAVAQWIAADVCPCDDECDSGCIGTGDRLARILADAGLLAGTMPEAPECDREHLPVGQRRRSPEGAEVIKTDDLATDPWRRYRGPCPAWFTDAEVAGWEVITDAPEAPKCDREHLPEGHVPITFNGWSDDDLKVAVRVVGSGALGASIRAELARRGES